MSEYNYDVIVIGSGPAGGSAAVSAAIIGKRAAMIEARPMVGGNCTHKGTIPSKSLRHVVKQILRFKNDPIFRTVGDIRTLTYPEVLSAASRVIPKQVEMYEAHYPRNRIQLYNGEAKFVDAHTVEVSLADGVKEQLTAENFVIATGSRPYRPVDVCKQV